MKAQRRQLSSLLLGRAIVCMVFVPILQACDSKTPSEEFRDRLYGRLTGQSPPVGKNTFYESAAVVLNEDAKKVGFSIFDSYIMTKGKDPDLDVQLEYVLIIGESEEFLDFIRKDAGALSQPSIDMIRRYIGVYRGDEEPMYIQSLYSLVKPRMPKDSD